MDPLPRLPNPARSARVPARIKATGRRAPILNCGAVATDCIRQALKFKYPHPATVLE
jgi:hypothetical protein